MSDRPRRIQMLKWCEAERMIQCAVDEVERMGADVRLTDAVCLLGAARDRVADFVDSVEGKRTIPGPLPVPVDFEADTFRRGPALPAEHAPPDKKQLAEIRARLAATTPGPWSSFMGSGINQSTALMREDAVTGMLHFVADFCPDYALDNSDSRLSRGDHIPDMRFVEHAPEDIRYLLDLLGSRPALAGRPPLYVYHGPHEGFKVLHFPELPNERAVVLGPGDTLELRWGRVSEGERKP